MSTNLGNYQATNETMDDRSPLPPATYLAMISESQVKPTKAGNGTIIPITFEVIDGEFKGRKVFTNINYENPNAIAQQIGRKELNTIMAACRIATVQDTTQLHGIPMLIEVSIEAGDGQYAPKNKCDNYHYIDPNADPQDVKEATAQNSSQQTETVQKATPEDDTPSWAK